MIRSHFRVVPNPAPRFESATPSNGAARGRDRILIAQLVHRARSCTYGGATNSSTRAAIRLSVLGWVEKAIFSLSHHPPSLSLVSPLLMYEWANAPARKLERARVGWDESRFFLSASPWI